METSRDESSKKTKQENANVDEQTEDTRKRVFKFYKSVPSQNLTSEVSPLEINSVINMGKLNEENIADIASEGQQQKLIVVVIDENTNITIFNEVGGIMESNNVIRGRFNFEIQTIAKS